jgi:hypothetical protein
VMPSRRKAGMLISTQWPYSRRCARERRRNVARAGRAGGCQSVRSLRAPR